MAFLSICATALCSVVVLFLLTKIMGHKQIAQLDFFDYVTGITIGSIAAELATELEQPWKPLTAMVIYGSVTLLLSILSGKFPRMRKYLNGSPTILLNNGRFYRQNMKKAKLELSEFMVMCRQQGYFDLNDIKTAVFEFNGKLSILPISKKRPANPQDLNLSPQQEYIQTEVTMDGRILGENLKRLGLDIKWLQKQLQLQGYKDPKDIFLALCDENKQLTVFKAES